MKNVNLFIIAITFVISGLIVVSCNDDQEELNYQPMKKVFVSPSYSTQALAFELAEAIMSDNSLATSINSAVDRVCSYGLDETLALFDILNPGQSVFFQANELTGFTGLFANVLGQLNLTSANYYGNATIYWGYHDSWDRKTMPIICYIDSNTTQNSTRGYEIVNNQIQNVSITENVFDSETRPIIVININDIDYADYPDFKNGERERNGVYWPEEIQREPRQQGSQSTYNDPLKVYRLGLTQFKSGGRQWDNWWAGGSEFYIKSAYTSTPNSSLTTKHACPFTRKQIKNRKIKNYNFLDLNSDWRTEFLDMVLVILEQDGGSSRSINFQLSVQGLASLNVTIPKFSWDDELSFNSTMTRSAYMSFHNAGDTYFYTGDGCRLKLDLNIYDRM